MDGVGWGVGGGGAGTGVESCRTPFGSSLQIVIFSNMAPMDRTLLLLLWCHGIKSRPTDTIFLVGYIGDITILFTSKINSSVLFVKSK